MASLGFGKAARTRTQNHRNHQCYQQTPQLPAPENQRRQSIVAIQLRCHRVTPSGCQSRQCLGLGVRCECGLLGQRKFTSSLPLLNHGFNFSIAQTAKRHRGFRVHFKPKTCADRQAYAIAAPALARSVHFPV